MAVRVLIVDDHLALACGLRDLFTRHDEIRVGAVASSGAEAIDLLESLQPELVLLDSRLPDMPGAAVAEEIRQRGLPARVLAYSAYGDEEHVKSMLSAGAMGYLLKTESLDVLVEAVLAVARGEMRFSPPVMEMVYAWGTSHPDALDKLSAREWEVLRHMALGETNPQIAEALSIGNGTVKNHIGSIYSKLGVNSRVQAVLFALERGLK